MDDVMVDSEVHSDGDDEVMVIYDGDVQVVLF